MEWLVEDFCLGFFSVWLVWGFHCYWIFLLLFFYFALYFYLLFFFFKATEKNHTCTVLVVKHTFVGRTFNLLNLMSVPSQL